MDLETFVAETLRQLIAGVKKAQESTQVEGANINPDVAWPTYAALAQNKIQKVEFDVAVTATEGSEKKAGIGVAMAMFVAGGEATSNTVNTSISRIRFAVPIILPEGAAVRKHGSRSDTA